MPDSRSVQAASTTAVPAATSVRDGDDLNKNEVPLSPLPYSNAAALSD